MGIGVLDRDLTVAESLTRHTISNIYEFGERVCIRLFEMMMVDDDDDNASDTNVVKLCDNRFGTENIHSLYR